MTSDIKLVQETMLHVHVILCVRTWQCHVVDCVGEWAENRSRVPNCVRLHHQIDQALSFFCVRATLKNREWPGDEAIFRMLHPLYENNNCKNLNVQNFFPFVRDH